MNYFNSFSLFQIRWSNESLPPVEAVRDPCFVAVKDKVGLFCPRNCVFPYTQIPDIFNLVFFKK